MVEFQNVRTNGIELRVATAGPVDGPLVILVHGFPESWYSWRHQLKALGDAGYHVAAPDVRGYGGSDQPHPKSAYSMQNMAADMAGLPAVLAQGVPAVIIGHDWGAPIAWNTALLYPDLFRAVAGMSIPHMPMGQFTILDMTQRLFIDNNLFFYMHYFQEPGLAEAEFGADTARAIRTFYYIWSGDAPDDIFPAKPADSKMFDKIGEIPETMPAWFTPEDEAYYVGEFERAGWRGALNRYRNFDVDRNFLSALADQVIQQPALFITGARDPAAIMFPGDLNAIIAPNYKDLRGVHSLEGCGHWVQQERVEETNKLLLDWLGGL